MNSKIITIPKVENPSGNYAIIEGATLPFDIKRVYYLYDIPSGSERGGHSHIGQQEFLVAASGSFDVILKDGAEEVKIILNKPDKGLLIYKGVWRELNNFSAGAVCLVMSSDIFDESDYIRDYSEYLKSI
ncbi:FdtA/QdtA family cupin domain-containing protein [Flavobacterium sp.]|uniref:sugar 3,4-ketoisomerase n=1 Tax=Flavobacterium sp. TaxID=239 RepID=UPI0025D8D9F9|nr:FdtA/QdtA family cupin domain-containing protein [Flavobacterium sp.]